MTARALSQPIFAPVLRQDLALARKLHAWRTPRWIRLWTIYASRGGDGHFWWVAGLLILGFGGSQRYAAVGSGALAAAVALFCFIALKHLTRRPRPNRVHAHCWSTAKARDEFSFPSGHTLTAFAVVTALRMFYPEFSPLLLFLAISIAASRMVLGLHYLSDVLAGGALGAAVGYGCALLLLH